MRLLNLRNVKKPKYIKSTEDMLLSENSRILKQSVLGNSKTLKS